MSQTKSITYYSDRGETNTDETLRVAKQRATELNIKDIIVATTRGETAVKAVELFKGYNVVIVTHVTGMKDPGVQELTEDNARKIKAAGGNIVTSGHAFMGVNRAIQKQFETMYPAGIIAQTLRLFGQGMKVVVEITAMAVDAGAIPVDKDVLAIAGSGKGADTAVVIKPSNSHTLFDIMIREIVAKPRTP